MVFIASILLLALTRAEIIDRMKAPPITVVQGLVSVYGDCGKERRRTFQQPIAMFAGDVCRDLYQKNSLKESRFPEPRIVIHIGDSEGGETNVVTHVSRRDGDKPRFKILLPSPAHSDMDALRLAVVRGFCLAVLDKELDDAGANAFCRSLDPVLRAEDDLAKLDAWRDEGAVDAETSDEDMLKEMRKVHVPGRILKSELRSFASRLYLLPGFHRHRFAGKYECVSFREAIGVREEDPRIRLAAYRKIPELIIHGGGHGEEMDAAVAAYCEFLNKLAIGTDEARLLEAMLDVADRKLKELEK